MNIKNISSFSIFCFLLLFSLRQLTLATPMLYAREVGTATWIAEIIVSILATIYMYITLKLYKSFDGKDIFDMTKFVGGNILYRLSCIIYCVIFSCLCIVFLKEISEGIQLLLFNTTPTIYIQLFYCIAMFIGSIIGIEGIIRTSGYLIPTAFIFLMLILVLSSNFFNINNIFPILGNGVNKIVFSSLKLLPSYLGVLIILFTMPHIPKEKSKEKIIYIYILVAFVFAFFTLLALTLSFGYPYTENNLFSFYELANMTNANKFFKHSEGLYVISNLFMGFLFLMTLFYFAVYCFKSLISKNKYIEVSPSKASNPIKKYWINLLLIIVIIFLCNLPQNIFSTFYFKEFINLYLLLPFVFVYPLLLLIISNIKVHIRER